MARTRNELSTGARLADYLTVGFLAMNCPVAKVQEVLSAHGAQSKRRRGLPHEVLVYFVMAMVLYANVAYEEVVRLVIEGLRQFLGDERLAQSTVTKGAISQARQKVGVAPLRDLYCEQVQPHGGRATISRGRRNPRGVKRKMSSFPIRKRGSPLHQPCDPKPVILPI